MQQKNTLKVMVALFSFIFCLETQARVHFPIFGHSADQTDCPDKLEAHNLTQVQQSYSPSMKRCYLSISNRNNYQTLVYRDYLISSEGHLMAFLSFGPGPDATTTGAKEFYFFPRNTKKQDFHWDNDNSILVVKATTPFDYIFDTTTSEITEIANAQVFIDPKISKENNGGITMIPQTGLVLEFPFQLGKAPTSIPTLKGYFIDSKSHRCSMKVSDLFKVLNQDGDVAFKYTDAQLTKLLKTKCPQLEFSLEVHE